MRLSLNEYALANKQKSIPAKAEADIYAALDMAYLPPEMREDTGEVELAAAKKVPTLITDSDIREAMGQSIDIVLQAAREEWRIRIVRPRQLRKVLRRLMGHLISQEPLVDRLTPHTLVTRVGIVRT